MPEKSTDADAMLPNKFKGLWCRALELSSLSGLNAETIALWAKDAGLEVQEAVEKPVGAFRPIPAVVLTVGGRTAYFPTVSSNDDPPWVESRRAHERIAAIWSKAEWFEPLWVPRGRIGPLFPASFRRSPGCA